jgi:putative folate metabolism gamma-glutamate ligase
MIVKAIKTRKVTAGSGTLLELLDEYLTELKEGSVVAITSKVAALCEGRIVPKDQANKQDLVIREADYYLPKNLSKYGFSFTIIHNTLVPAAGVDESNGNGNYVLWPIDPQKTVNEVRHYLKKRFGLREIGVILTDSTARPLHYGTEGVAIRYSGFSPSNNYIGTPDLFGRTLEVSISNVVDALASAAVVVMGEGAEQTPIAVISDIPFVAFQDHDPTLEELKKFYLEHMEDDLFEPFLRQMGWREGGHRGKG